MRMNLKPFLAMAILGLALSCSPAPQRVVRIMTYNVGVFDKYDASGIDVSAAMISELQPDVLVLNEVDSCAARTGNVDQMACFTEALGDFDGLFAPALKPFMGGAYGVAEVWKNTMKPLDMFKILLPKGDGSETRALVVVEYEDMVVAGTHLEHKSKTTQMDQAKIVSDTLKAMYSSKPVFLCGDFNALPDSPTIEFMRQNWDILSPEETTYPDKETLQEQMLQNKPAGKCIDYVMIMKGSAEYEVAAASVVTAFKSGSAFEASDHLPVCVDVRF